MLDLPYKIFNSSQLNKELQALNLPGFIGVASKEGVYLRIKCGTLSPAQEQAIRDVVAIHVPDTSPSAYEVRKARVKELLAKGLSGMTAAEKDEAMIKLGQIL